MGGTVNDSHGMARNSTNIPVCGRVRERGAHDVGFSGRDRSGLVLAFKWTSATVISLKLQLLCSMSAMEGDRRERRQRLFHDTAADQRGYFTAAQARHVGYSYQAQAHHVDAGN